MMSVTLGMYRTDYPLFLLSIARLRLLLLDRPFFLLEVVIVRMPADPLLAGRVLDAVLDAMRGHVADAGEGIAEVAADLEEGR